MMIMKIDVVYENNIGNHTIDVTPENTQKLIDNYNGVKIKQLLIQYLRSHKLDKIMEKIKPKEIEVTIGFISKINNE